MLLDQLHCLRLAVVCGCRPAYCVMNPAYTSNAYASCRLEWVKNTGKKKLVMAGLWTEVCFSLPVIDALAVGHEVYIVTDASGGGSTEDHERGVRRMVQAGAQPLTTIAYVSELQLDWARPTANEVAKLFAKHGGDYGQGLRWEWQLLALKEGTR